MSDSTRRNFLIASGAGAAAVGVAAALPGAAAAQAPTSKSLTEPRTTPSPWSPTSATRATGTLSLFVADHEVVVHDPDLVARITRAARSNHGRRDVIASRSTGNLEGPGRRQH